MTDIIKLLPDAIANQIAAGEVIQRPASVIKELLENALDAESTEINVIIKDAGKTLIQVIDNGKGMSPTDARMCFERHATSKIRKADDLFKIDTMGFRGEAMASIASIAHVELISRTKIQEVATKILIKGSEVEKQESCSAPTGTSILVKNLFYNVPARRKFLKSDPTELKHLLDEFIRIAIAHPEVHFTLFHNENELYHLPTSNLRQRIVAVMGKNYNEKLVPVEEVSDWIKIEGFVGKPEASKRTKGEQYLFVNHRFIKSNYINHAIRHAYEELIPKENYPLYVMFITIDPAKIDVNVHPTKQEIKFEEERLVYNFMKVAVRHGIGKYTLTPVIDFEQGSDPLYSRKEPSQSFDMPVQRKPPSSPHEKENIRAWESIYDGLQGNSESEPDAITLESRLSSEMDLEEKPQSQKRPMQMQGSYILSQIKSGLMVIDQQAAHERILYEQYLSVLNQQETLTQKMLFSENIHLDTSKAELLKSLLPQINQLGFEIEEFGHDSFVVRGLPQGFNSENGIQADVENLLEDYLSDQEFSSLVEEKIAKTLAQKTAVKRGNILDNEEMQDLIDQLFTCESPYQSPTGRKCFVTIELEDIKKRFTQ